MYYHTPTNPMLIFWFKTSDKKTIIKMTFTVTSTQVLLADETNSVRRQETYSKAVVELVRNILANSLKCRKKGRKKPISNPT